MPDGPVICDICGQDMPPHSHYVVRIDIFADPEMPPMTAEQIAGANFDQALAEILAEVKHMSADELQDQVHRRFEYRICGPCQRRFLANPLGKPRLGAERKPARN